MKGYRNCLADIDGNGRMTGDEFVTSIAGA